MAYRPISILDNNQDSMLHFSDDRINYVLPGYLLNRYVDKNSFATIITSIHNTHEPENLKPKFHGFCFLISIHQSHSSHLCRELFIRDCINH